MGKELVVKYSPEAMLDLMVAQPGYSSRQYAAHFGKNLTWYATVVANNDFQTLLGARRNELADPTLTATIEERFRALALHSVMLLQERLEEGDSESVPSSVLVQASAMAIKALGMGQNMSAQAVAGTTVSAESVADRLLSAMDVRDAKRTIEVASIDGK